MLTGSFLINKLFVGDNGTTIKIKGGDVYDSLHKLTNIYKGKTEKYVLVYTKEDWSRYTHLEGEYITLSISDRPTDKGFYSLKMTGKLPDAFTFDNLNTFMADTFSVKNFYSSDFTYELRKRNNSKIVWDYIVNGVITDEENMVLGINRCSLGTFKRRYSKEISRLKNEYYRQKNIFNFISVVSEIGLVNQELQLKLMEEITEKHLAEFTMATKENPYILAHKFPRLLPTIDDFIKKNNFMPDNDSRRISAILDINLQIVANSEGDTWLYIDGIIDNQAQMWHGFNTDKYTITKEDILSSCEDSMFVWTDGSRVASLKYRDMELAVANLIYKCDSETGPLIGTSIVNSAIKEFEKSSGFKVTSEQRAAVFNSLKANVVALCGYAGTGKSTILKILTNLYAGKKILVTALSGKATLRLKETTKIENAMTMQKAILTKVEQYINADLIVIDEGSMIGLALFKEFFECIKPGTHVIIAGDWNQVLPIGAAAPFRDILQSGIVKSMLTVPHRQKGANILEFATNARTQTSVSGPISTPDMIIIDESDVNKIVDKTIDIYFELLSKYKKEEIFITCPRKMTPAGVYNINNIIQERMISMGLVENVLKDNVTLYFEKDVNGTTKPYYIFKGDRIINVQNNNTIKDINGEVNPITNGSLGTVLDIIVKKEKGKNGKVKEKIEYLIEFDGIGKFKFTPWDLNNLWLAYASTIHKLQGSQAKAVIFPHTFSDKMSTSEVVYTGVTRAEEVCYVISSIVDLNKAILIKRLFERKTFLLEFLNDLMNFSINDDGQIEGQLNVFDEVSVELQVSETAVAKKDTNLVAVEPESIKQVDETASSKPHVSVFDKSLSDEKRRKLRARYDRNNAQRKKKWLNENGLKAREQSKQDKLQVIKELKNQGLTQKEVVEKTGISKASVSRYWKEC